MRSQFPNLPHHQQNCIDPRMFSRRNALSTTFDPERTIQPIYTGGDVALDDSGRILATCLGEDVVVTDLSTGKMLAKIEGVGRNL